MAVHGAERSRSAGPALTPPRRRLDRELVRRELFDSRRAAQEAVAAGRVTVGGAPAGKAGRLVHAGEAIVVLGEGPRHVSRAGAKLESALDRFGVAVEGARTIDVGASTGGFTDCLLQRGAASVVALDVGRAQLHERLRDDPRVRVLERTNVRHVGAAEVGGPFDLVVVDLSFISLRTVAARLRDLMGGEGRLVALVKPQFEAGRREAARARGVIRDPRVWARVLEEVAAALAAEGAVIMEGMVSPVHGTSGNVEFLVHARPSATGAVPALDVGALVALALAEARATGER